MRVRTGRRERAAGAGHQEVESMKLLTAIVRPEKLDDAMAAVTDVGAGGLTVTEVRGFGKQYGHINPADRLAERRALVLPKLRLDLVVRDEAVEAVASAIAKAVGIGAIGDGKIWVSPVDSVLRIRTGERDDGAL
jgi:nitrogen regulatory protein PII